MRTTMGAAAAAAMLSAGLANAALINEFQPNPPGSDPATTLVELIGTPGASFSGALLSIDSDISGGTFIGTVDRFTAVSGTFDANGLLVVEIGDLENPSFSFVLTANDGTAALGDDLDADGDGLLDAPSVLGTVLDAINVPDSDADAAAGYADQIGGVSLAFIGFEPLLMFREAGTLDWFAAGSTDVFDVNGNLVDPSLFNLDPTASTYGAVNPALATIPVPAPLLLLASALGVLGLRRRR